MWEKENFVQLCVVLCEYGWILQMLVPLREININSKLLYTFTVFIDLYGFSLFKTKLRKL